MEEELKPVYKEYKLSRDTIQLISASIFKCSAEVCADLSDVQIKSDPKTNLKLLQGYNWIDDKRIVGHLKAEVGVCTEDKGIEFIKFLIECQGIFFIYSKENVDKKIYNHRMELQLVPQLLPYIRSTLTTLSAVLNIPPVILPTMDILQSIKKNGQIK